MKEIVNLPPSLLSFFGCSLFGRAISVESSQESAREKKRDLNSARQSVLVVPIHVAVLSPLVGAEEVALQGLPFRLKKTRKARPVELLLLLHFRREPLTMRYLTSSCTTEIATELHDHFSFPSFTLNEFTSQNANPVDFGKRLNALTLTIGGVDAAQHKFKV